MVRIVVRFIIQVILEILLLGSLVLNTFVLEKYNSTFALIVLSVFFVISLFLFKSKKGKSRYTSDAIFVVVGFSIILLGILYLVGFKTGFNFNYNSMFRNYIKDSVWIIVFLIVIISELIRYFTVPLDSKQKVRNAIHYILMVSIFIMVDITVCTKVYDLSKFYQLYEFISLVVVQSVSKNIFLYYLAKDYGIWPCLVYRALIDLYIYYMPVTPEINMFIEGVVFFVFPYFVYMMIKSITERKVVEPARKNKKESKFVTIFNTIVFAILVALVSREFSWAMIAIGSGSMTGTINKGDAVIYKVYDKEKDELEPGEVMVFYKGNMMIVHRIIKKYTIYDEVVYQTKGDANEKPDNWIVKEEDVVGIVKFRVPWIAWPSVKLNEWF